MENTTQTEIGTLSSNPSKNIYGSKITLANYSSILIVGKLESGVKYYIKMYCVNFNDIASDF